MISVEVVHDKTSAVAIRHERDSDDVITDDVLKIFGH